MTSNSEPDLLDTKPDFGISFAPVAAPIEPEVRPIWRISLAAVILLMLGRGGKASPKKLLVLSSIVSSERKRKLLSSVLKGEVSALELNVRFDPSLDRAIDFGLAEGLLALDSAKNVELTEKGRGFATRILQADDVFVTEKDFLEEFKKSDFTEDVVQRIIAG